MSTDGVSLAGGSTRGNLRAALHWWWPMLFFIAAAPLLGALLPAYLPVDEPIDYAPGDWVMWGLESAGSGESVTWRSTRESIGMASRLASMDPRAEFLELRVCIAGGDSAAEGSNLLLVSLRDGIPQLNRQFRFHDFADTPPGVCATDILPRLAGDDAGPERGVLQLQISGGELSLAALTVRALEENPPWRIVRRVALPLGIALLALPLLAGLARTQSSRPSPYRQLRLAMGLLTVAAIIFGCCVSVGLKAQIFALLIGGAEGEPWSPEMLLGPSSPGKGLGLFTIAHAVLFAVAALLLVPLARRAWVDLALLALATETLQRFVPGRGPGFGDVVVDWSGLLVAALLLAALRLAQRQGLFLQQ